MTNENQEISIHLYTQNKSQETRVFIYVLKQ